LAPNSSIGKKIAREIEEGGGRGKFLWRRWERNGAFQKTVIMKRSTLSVPVWDFNNPGTEKEKQKWRRWSNPRRLRGL